MDTLIEALAAPFAAGFAVQRLLEILDPVLDKISQDNKKLLLALVSLVAGLGLSFGLGLRALQSLGVNTSAFVDGIATALIISAGTEGFNSILKFLGYAKEEKKAEAAAKRDSVAPESLEMVQRAV